MTIIRTPRLLLRPPVEADAERIFALASNWNVARMTAKIPHPYTMELAHDYIAAIKTDAETGEALHFVIALDGEFIGAVSAGLRKPSLGYWIGEPYWGKGYMTEATHVVVRHFFETRTADRLASAYLDDNVASRKIQDRLGFEVTERAMAYSLARDGEAPGVHTVLTRKRFFELNT